VFLLVSARFVHPAAIGISVFSFARNIESMALHASIKFQAIGTFLSSNVLLEGSGGGYAIAIRGVIGRVTLGTTGMRLTRTTVLLYMTTPEDVTKRRCTNTPVLASHSSHVHGRQHAQRTDLPTKYEYSTSSPHVWPQHGGPQPDLTLSFGPDSDPLSSPFTVTRFEMIVESDHQSVHCLTQMHSNGRLGSFEVLDLASWRRQYRDLDFLLSETESWMRSGRKVLVCTASIGSMAGVPSDADLITTFDLDSHVDLSTYDHLECMTRFYEDQDDAVDAQFDSTKQYREEERTSCEYQSGLQGSKGVLRVDFGAQTWIRQMREYQYMRHRDEEDVREPLQYLTATQDIYGIVSQAGKAQCLLTVLWRFNQTENSAEVGSMEWRSVNFASCRSAAEERWCHETEHKTEDVEDMEVGHEKTANNPMFTPPDVTSYHQASQLPPDFAQTHVTRHPYETEPHHHHQPPSLSIDILGSMQPDLDHLDSSAATTTTEFSQQSFALSHTQGMGPSNTHSNDFDFNCSHIPISGAFDSTMNMPVYGSFPNQSAGLGGLHTLAGLEHDEFSTMGLAIGENGQLVPVDTSNDLHDSTILSCYSTKPHWQHACLISHLENAAEQYNSYPIHDDRARGVYNQEVIPGHDAYAQVGQREESAATNLHDFNHSLWGLQELQSPFQDDTGSGAVRGLDYRKEQTYGSDYGVPDLVEKRQKGCGY
jgi:transcriptional enhancer factor